MNEDLNTDSHPLAALYAEACKFHGPPDNPIEEMAREVAIDLIVSAGLDASDHDSLGEAVGGSVQSHLMVAFMRCPAIAEMLEKRLAPNPLPSRKARMKLFNALRLVYVFDTRIEPSYDPHSDAPGADYIARVPKFIAKFICKRRGYWDHYATPGGWHVCQWGNEVRLSACQSGCKVYACSHPGCDNEKLVHSYIYGCPQSVTV